MALFHDSLVQKITTLLGPQQQEAGTVQGQPSTLQQDLELLIRVANGEYQRKDTTVRKVELALTRVLEQVQQSKATAPADFWQTDLGILISRVRWWVSVDDLISISNAAALAFGENTQANRMRIGRAIENGLLEWVPDPSVANPQQNKRVLRPQVERLRDLNQLPEPEEMGVGAAFLPTCDVEEKA